MIVITKGIIMLYIVSIKGTFISKTSNTILKMHNVSNEQKEDTLTFWCITTESILLL